MQRKFGRVEKESIALAAVGHKDVGKTNFELWKRIFGETTTAKAAQKQPHSSSVSNSWSLPALAVVCQLVVKFAAFV